MKEALALAERGRGAAHPNPFVGAVLVRNNAIIARGAHDYFGGPHAEVSAIRRIPANRVKGSTLYVTLEPCSHFGKTPPCADLIISCGIRRVVIGSKDPNPLVCGRGIRRLKAAGVEVTEGVMEKEAAALNKDFAFWIRRKRPYVTVKAAQSLDGKIATRAGRSKWITGIAARRFGHRLRSRHDAVLVGLNTVLADNPRLDARLADTRRDPIRIVLDSFLRSPLSSRFLKGAPRERIWVVTTRKAPPARIRAMEKKAVVIVAKEKNPGRIDWNDLLARLGRRGLVNLLIEGGAKTIGSAFSQKVVREVYFFVAPIIIGGRDAPGSVGDPGIRFLKEAPRLRSMQTEYIGGDLLIRGEL